MIYFTYITTNLINGKQYVGDHSTNDLNDGYIGSGRPAFDNAKKKYGKQNFKLQILEFFNSKKEAFDAQEKYINEYNTLVPNGYNISPKGGNGVFGCHSEETKQKISNSEKGKIVSEETKLKQSLNNGSKTEQHKIKNRLSHLGKKQSNETKLKRSISSKGRISGMLGKNQSNEAKLKISKAHKGKIVSDETKKKMSAAKIGKKMAEETKKKISLYHKNKNNGFY